MRRLILTLAAVIAAAAALAAPAASAHPLGNFSINHLVSVRVSTNRVDLHYILDQAEIPTFQERSLSNAAVLARKRSEVQRNLTLTVDGQRTPLQLMPQASLSHPPGQGGLPLTRVELSLQAHAPGAQRRVVRVHDATFPGRVGWKAIITLPGSGTAVRSSVPSADPTKGLRSYPQDALSSPLDQRSATLIVRPGAGSVIAPNGRVEHGASTRNRSGDGFAGIFANAAAGKGVLLFLLLAAFGWGAIHALSPGHGKSMVAAYLIGTRGTVRDAVALGATVTITHTIGVFALGLVTLALSQYVLPEQLYPWLNLASGLLVLAIGAGVLRARIRTAKAHDHDHAHTHDHGHAHDHPHDHDHTSDRDHPHDNSQNHPHPHRHDHVSTKGIIAMGASAGLLPCPSALVVLLAAIAQHQIALGLLMIVVFSLGLATTLTGLGVAVVSAGRVTSKLNISPRLTTALPAISALVIVVAGAILTVHAVPQLA
jgi:nickel/cobalt transporter (NicO) family protein